MGKVKETVFCFVILMISLTLAQHEGNTCTFRRSRSPGICVHIRNCIHAQMELQKGNDVQFCGNAPIVCCPRGSGGYAPVPEDNCQPLPDYAVKVTKGGGKAWDYCIDLANKIFKCAPQILDFARERQDTCTRTGNTLVINGVDAEENEFPYMAILGYMQDGAMQLLCGGTLINERWVLTAAHCIRRNVNYLVRLGSPALDDPINPRNRFSVTNITRHPDYHSGMKYHDIALWQLDREVRFDNSIFPACLQVEKKNFDTVTVTGWGETRKKTAAHPRGEKTSNRLQKARLNLFQFDVCSRHHKIDKFNAPYGILDDRQVCYGSTDTNDSCWGDSGGPLVVHNNHIVYCTYSVVAIVSLGVDCGISNFPAVYTRVDHYIPWIESIVWP